MKKLSLNGAQFDQSTLCMENIVTELPRGLSGHRSVVYNR